MKRSGKSTIKTMSSREFNQDTSRAKKAALQGPVVITDRGRAAHVLLSIEEYRRLSGSGSSIADLLALPGGENIELVLPSRNEFAGVVDLG